MGQLNLYKRIFQGPLKVVVSEPKKVISSKFLLFPCSQLIWLIFPLLIGIKESFKNNVTKKNYIFWTSTLHSPTNPFPPFLICHRVIIFTYLCIMMPHTCILICFCPQAQICFCGFLVAGSKYAHKLSILNFAVLLTNYSSL